MAISLSVHTDPNWRRYRATPEGRQFKFGVEAPYICVSLSFHVMPTESAKRPRKPVLRKIALEMSLDRLPTEIELSRNFLIGKLDTREISDFTLALRHSRGKGRR
jgi:hypothetical protein